MAAARKLKIEFSTEDAFRSEYASNIAKGGIFVASREELPVREAVQVEIALAWCGRTFTLDGEIVHVVPASMEQAGATPGVAVQFLAATSELRREFDALAGPPEANERVSRSGRRAAPRFVARVTTRVRSRGRPELEARSRDVSSSGILLALDADPLPIGEAVELEVEHPQSGECMGIAGTVVRHLHCEEGEVTALGIEFHTPEARQTEVSAFMNDVRAAEHSRRLGSITGPIAELGIENLLQMFGSSSPRGTLIVTRGVEEGFIVFEGGALLGARLGRRSGRSALERMLRWRDGSFEFHSRIDDLEGHEDERIPLNAAILDALCKLDESHQLDESHPLDESHRLDESRCPAPSDSGFQELDLEIGDPQADHEDLPSGATFSVDLARADRVRDELAKTEQAILDLAAVGMTVARIGGVIPEPASEVQAALHSLLQRGVLRRR